MLFIDTEFLSFIITRNIFIKKMQKNIAFVGGAGVSILGMKRILDYMSVLSPGYNEQSKDLYFNQCFQVISKLGAGSFGEVRHGFSFIKIKKNGF